MFSIARNRKRLLLFECESAVDRRVAADRLEGRAPRGRGDALVVRPIAPAMSPAASAVLPRAKSILVLQERAGSLAGLAIALAGKIVATKLK